MSDRRWVENEPDQRRPGEGARPDVNRRPDPTPDIAVQVRDPRADMPPCLTEAQRSNIENEIRERLVPDFPGVDVRSACGRGPAGDAACFAVRLPARTASGAERDAALVEPVRQGQETYALFLGSGFISAFAELAWSRVVRRLRSDGVADRDGSVHLTRLSVALKAPRTIITTIKGFDEQAVPDADFTVTITDQIDLPGLGEVTCSSAQDITVDSGLQDLLTVVAGILVGFNPAVFPVFALALMQSIEMRMADPPSTGGVGRALFDLFVPPALLVGGGMKNPIFYSRVASLPHGLVVGGSLQPQVPRTPLVSIAGPSEVIAPPGHDVVERGFRAQHSDLRGPLRIIWTSAAEVRGEGDAVRILFEKPLRGKVDRVPVSVVLTDIDGLTATAAHEVRVSARPLNDPHSQPSRNPRAEP